jgi:hypothetical protein
LAYLMAAAEVAERTIAPSHVPGKDLLGRRPVTRLLRSGAADAL